jgi:hypothetical protein
VADSQVDAGHVEVIVLSSFSTTELRLSFTFSLVFQSMSVEAIVKNSTFLWEFICQRGRMAVSAAQVLGGVVARRKRLALVSSGGGRSEFTEKRGGSARRRSKGHVRRVEWVVSIKGGRSGGATPR